MPSHTKKPHGSSSESESEPSSSSSSSSSSDSDIETLTAQKRDTTGFAMDAFLDRTVTGNEQDLKDNPTFFPGSRNFLSADNLTLYAGYTLSDNFRWYGEATAQRATAIDGRSGGQTVGRFGSWTVDGGNGGVEGADGVGLLVGTVRRERGAGDGVKAVGE